MISVVIATYQGARFIRSQLSSILAQLDSTDEVIVCDDNSSDRTLEEVLSIGDARVRVLRNAVRVGYVRNFERCLHEVRGSYVFFSDQDDIWLPGKVRRMMEMLARADCVASDVVVVDESLKVIHESYFRFRNVRGWSAWEMFSRPPIIGATMACRTGFVRRFQPLPPSVPHDMWLTFNAAVRGSLGVIAEPLILYRRHGDVASFTASGRRRALVPILFERARLLGWAAAFACGFRFRRTP